MNRESQLAREDFQRVPENLWRARVIHTNDFEYCSPPEDMVIQRGEIIVASTRYGRDMARLLGSIMDRDGIEAREVRLINRIATEEDLKRREMLQSKETEAHAICQEKISNLGLAMRLVIAHYVFDEPGIVFFFTADTRIDFRKLVRELVSHFKTRIELRQIGARDETRTVGGLAVCGRPCCCHGVTDKLAPVSIRMAKDQNLSLNSLKISGPCGRLLCCLAYEHEYYASERKLMPREGSRITYKGTNYIVNEVDVFARKFHVNTARGHRMEVPVSRSKCNDNGIWTILPEENSVAADTAAEDT